MSELSHENKSANRVLINRKGQIEYVMVGDAKAVSNFLILSRVRVAVDRFRVDWWFIHTHLLGEKLTQRRFNSTLRWLRIWFAAIQVDSRTGLPNLVHSAHLCLQPPIILTIYRINFEPEIPSQLDIDFADLIRWKWAEMAKSQNCEKSSDESRPRNFSFIYQGEIRFLKPKNQWQNSKNSHFPPVHCAWIKIIQRRHKLIIERF